MSTGTMRTGASAATRGVNPWPIAVVAATATFMEVLDTTIAAIRWIGQQVQTQASFLAHMDAFSVLALISLAAVPLALSLRKVKLGGPAPAGH